MVRKKFKKWVIFLIGLLGSILLLLLIVPFFIPIPPLEGTVPPQDLADPDSQFLEIEGIKIHYKERGSGDTAIILLHGFASSIFSFREILGPLSQDRKVVAFDRPAFGLTERPLPGEWTEENPYSPEFQTKLTINLLDKLEINRAILLGHSAGASIALNTAIQFPERVGALVLVSPALNSRDNMSGFLRFLLNTPQVRHLGPLLVRSFKERGKELALISWNDPSKITPEIWEGYLKPLRVKNWDIGLWEFFRASHPLELQNRLSEIKIPVLIIQGEEDKIIPMGESILLKEKIPQAKMEIIPNCGHLPHEEFPQLFMSYLEEFLSKLSF